MFVRLVILLSVCFSLSCAKKPIESVKIGINPWPGYEFVYLAEQQGFFEHVGLNIKLVQMSSLSEAQRAYVNGRLDGLASTIIEAVQAAQLSNYPLKVILVPDYSNGGDVILANTDIVDVKQLKGKRVGCEVGSLGIFVLHKALTKHGLSLEDVEIKNVDTLDGERELLSGNIDAYVSYPPVSVSILRKPQFHKIFSSAEIPFEVIDTISIADAVLDQHPTFTAKFHLAWQMALDYANSHPREAYRIMAERQGISVEEFEDQLSGLTILDSHQQKQIFSQADDLQKSAAHVCNTLYQVGSLTRNCAELPDIVYRGPL